MKLVIIGHHTRTPQIEKLTQALEAKVFIDEGNHGALYNHLRALKWAAQQSERVVIMEDDAIPVIGFEEKIKWWFDFFPVQFLSFYLGTDRPPQYQPLIDERISDSTRLGREFIWLKQLIHGVCYSPPIGSYRKILDKIDERLPADFAVGTAWDGIVYYPIKSLVEHRDEISVEIHKDRRVDSGKRVARFLDGDLINV